MTKKVYWTDKKGRKIDIDTMSIEHLRNVLKHIVRELKDGHIPPKDTIMTTNELLNE